MKLGLGQIQIDPFLFRQYRNYIHMVTAPLQNLNRTAVIKDIK
jgi:hypothetical protein